jgi:hypothetical protein
MTDGLSLRDSPKPQGGIEIGDDMAFARIFVIAKPPAELAGFAMTTTLRPRLHGKKRQSKSV